MICAISQPTFLPWLGWFDLADQSDLMVILDDVQFSRQSWQQRNRIRTHNGLEYITVPVKLSGKYQQKIFECELANQDFLVKMIKSIQANYSKSKFYSENIDGFLDALKSSARTNSLVELNCSLISWMSKKLEVVTPMLRASKIGAGGARGEHVAAICEYLKADYYLSSAGAESYLLEDKQAFDRRGIEVLIQIYEHPNYTQRYQPFIPFASALDLIFNYGPSAGGLMRSGRQPTRVLGETFTNL